jgi:hypothetical protein
MEMMAKFYVFTIVSVGIMFLLYLAGVHTTSSWIINGLSGTNPFSVSGLWGGFLTAFFIAAIAITGGISILGFSKITPINAVVATFMNFIALFMIADMYSVVNLISSMTATGACSSLICPHTWVYYAAWAIIVPICAGTIVSAVSFTAGAD